MAWQRAEKCVRNGPKQCRSCCTQSSAAPTSRSRPRPRSRSRSTGCPRRPRMCECRTGVYARVHVQPSGHAGHASWVPQRGDGWMDTQDTLASPPPISWLTARTLLCCTDADLGEKPTKMPAVKNLPGWETGDHLMPYVGSGGLVRSVPAAVCLVSHCRRAAPRACEGVRATPGATREARVREPNGGPGWRRVAVG